jgi:hypothetical protein
MFKFSGSSHKFESVLEGDRLATENTSTYTYMVTYTYHHTNHFGHTVHMDVFAYIYTPDAPLHASVVAETQSARGEEWRVAAAQVLGSEYVEVVCRQMVGVMLIVYCTR